MTSRLRLEGVVVRGHGVASGEVVDPRFPRGTLAEQIPLFAEHGIDLTPYQRGTINLALDGVLLLDRPDHTVVLEWTPHLPPETFSLLSCVVHADGMSHEALIYQPDPDTKPDHAQPRNVVEVLAPPLGELLGRSLVLDVDATCAHLDRQLAY